MDLVAGDIFYGRIPGFGIHKARPVIVVHVTSDNKCVLVYASSQYEKVKRRTRNQGKDVLGKLPVTYVEFNPGDADIFTETCGVNCDIVELRKVESHLIDHHSDNPSKLKSKDKLHALIKGIKASNVVEEKVKIALDN